MFVRGVAERILTLLAASRVHLADGGAVGVSGSRDVVRAKGHRVRVASVLIAEVPAGHNSGRFEPAPGQTYLSSVAPHRKTTQKTAATRGICGRKQSLESSVGFYAKSVVESLRCAMRPAGSAVGLVSHVPDHRLASRPGFARVESGRNCLQEVARFH